jgi:hypothetical protein
MTFTLYFEWVKNECPASKIWKRGGRKRFGLEVVMGSRPIISLKFLGDSFCER